MASPLEIIQSEKSEKSEKDRAVGAIWSIDVSYDDQILSVGTEQATIDLYNLQKILNQYGKHTSQELTGVAA